MIDKVDWELALKEHLEEGGVERVYSQYVPNESDTPCVVMRESGSTPVYDLEGLWEINTADYELICLVAIRDRPMDAEVALKRLAQLVVDTLGQTPASAIIGDTVKVRIDSLILVSETTAQVDDGDKAGPTLQYLLRWRFAYDTREVPE